MRPVTRHERLARRRRLYTGGALLIVAPLAGGGCSNQPVIAPHPADASTPADVGAIAIAPIEVDGGTRADAGKAPPGGYGATCSADGDCLQEYSCQTPICVVACPSACAPLPCSPDCPTGFTCVDYGSAKTCVRDPGGTPGGYGATCVAHTDCLPPLFCQDTCPGMCIVPIMRCTPLDCSTALCPTDVQSTCEDVGITKACVRK